MLIPGTVSGYGAAVIGAIGAVIGGGLSIAGNLLIERSRTKHSDKAREVLEARDLRRAVRIVLEELSATNRVIIRTAKNEADWPEGRLSTEAWATYQPVLATHLSDEAWRWIAMAYDAATSLNDDAVELRQKANVGGVRFQPDTLREAFNTVHIAMALVEAQLGPMAGVFKYTGYASVDEMWPKGGKPN